jgi:two-component system response regulator GlrR
MSLYPTTPAPEVCSQGRDTIQIMRNVFNPEQLQCLMDQLGSDGHKCETFEGLDALPRVHSDPRTKLLVLGTESHTSSELLSVLRRSAAKTKHVPVLLHLSPHVAECKDDFLVPEIDDFFVDHQSVTLRVRRLDRQLGGKQEELDHAKHSLLKHLGMQQIVGKSPAFLSSIEKIPMAAACDVPVLLMGPTGTGKEMCARAIHYMSPRADKPFIPVNCGSIPVELFENEMFGHDSGAYTDARKSSHGLIAEAEGGTIFLDEVDSLPLSAQVKLLRFLQDRQYRPLGAAHYRRANVRLLAASNQNLHAKMREGSFREDFYYRLRVVSFTLPSLKERQEDVLLLANHFLKTAAKEYGRDVKRFSWCADQKLQAYSWPGNARELENLVRQAVVLVEGQVIYGDDLPILSQEPAAAASTTASSPRESFKVAKARIVQAFERKYLQDLVSYCGGNISKAAREAKKDRRAFFELLRKHNLT